MTRIAAVLTLLHLAVPTTGQTIQAVGPYSAVVYSDQVEILSPQPGDLLNDSTPAVTVEFQLGGIASESVVVLLDGLAVQDQLTILPQGIFGELDPIADGVHEVEILVVGDGRFVQPKKVSFETSTGGGPTRVFGFLLDPLDDAPIVGAQIHFEEGGPVAVTDGAGYYEIVGPPIGAGLHVIFDPVGLEFSDRVTMESWVYPKYKRVVDVYEGAKNSLAVCYLPRVEKLAVLGTLPEFDCGTSTFIDDYTLIHTELEVELTIPAGTYCEFPSGDPCGEYLSIANVPVDKAPSDLPAGMGPPILVTVQPTGMKFRTGPGGDLVPLPITFPNDVGIPPGNEMTLLSVDHELGAFVPMGTMLATAQGTFETIEGGLIGGSWHAPLPAEPEPGGAGPPPDQCLVPTNPDVRLSSGSIVEVFPLPKRRLFDEPYGPDLVYSSRALMGWETLAANMTYPVEGTPPTYWLIQAFVVDSGLPLGRQLSWDGGLITEASDTPLRLIYPIQTQGAPAGIYDVQLFHDLAWSNGDGCSWKIWYPGVPPIWYPGNPPLGGSCFTTCGRTSQLARLAVPAPAESGLGRGWRLSGDNRLIVEEGWASIHTPTGEVESLVDTVLGAGSGLQLRLFTGSSDTEVTSYFGTSHPVDFRVNDGTGAKTVNVATVPNANFWNAAGPYLLHVGVDGQQQTTDLTAPSGDDAVYEILSGADAFGVLLEGQLLLEQAQVATFTAAVDDACAVQIDGQTVLSLVGANPAGFVSSAPIALEAGLHQVRIALADKGGLTHLQLFWSPAGATSEVLPSTLLLPVEPDKPGGAFFRGVDGDFSEVTMLQDGSWRRDLGDKSFETYDADGRITSAVTRHGRTTTYQRDPSGRLLSIVDPVGGSYDLVYSGDQLAQITDPAGRATSFQQAGDDLVKITDAAGNPWQFGYDERGLLTTSINAEGHTTRHEYDGFGRYLRAIYADGADKRISYGDEQFVEDYFNPCLYQNFPYGCEGGSNAPVRYAFEPPEGKPVTVTNEAGMETVHKQGKQDASGEFGGLLTGTMDVHSVTDPLGRVSETWSSPEGLPLLSRTVASDDSLLSQSRYIWDVDRGVMTGLIEQGTAESGADNRELGMEWDAEYSFPIRLTEAVGTGLEVVTEYTVDPNLGEPIEVKIDGETVAAYEYDSYGMIAKEIDGLGREIVFGFDPLTRNPNSMTVGPVTFNWSLDAAGQPASFVLPDGVSTKQYAYDAMNRLTQVTDATAGVTTYTYDKLGNLLTTQEAGPTAPVTARQYDNRGRLTSLVESDGATFTFAYSPDGQVTSRTYPGAGQVSYVHDDVGRLVTATNGDGDISYNYDDRGLVVSTSNGSVLSSYEYDALGRPVAEVVSTNPPTVTSRVEYARDALDRTVEETVFVDGELSATLAYGFTDTSDAVSTVEARVFAGRTLIDSQVYTYGYDSTGRRSSLSGPDGLLTTYSYDDAATERLAEIRTTVLGVETSRDTYTHNGNGLTDGIDEVRTLLSDSLQSVVYDARRQIESYDFSDPASALLDYAPYDPLGNRNANVNTYGLGGELLATATHTYAYDARGNLSSKAPVGGGEVLSFEYDAINRLVEVSADDGSGPVVVESHVYGVQGQRVVSNGDRRIYAGHRLIAVVKSDGERHLVVPGPAAGEYIAFLGDGSHFQLVSDRSGSIVQIVDNGSVVAERRYGAFGELADEAGAWAQLPIDLGYCSLERDSYTGSYRTLTRHFLPSDGRFAQRDPARLEFGAPKSTSLLRSYVYAYNNGVELRDLDGRKPVSNEEWQKACDRWGKLDSANNGRKCAKAAALCGGVAGCVTAVIGGLGAAPTGPGALFAAAQAGALGVAGGSASCYAACKVLNSFDEEEALVACQSGPEAFFCVRLASGAEEASRARAALTLEQELELQCAAK